MVVTEQPRDSDARGPWSTLTAARSPALKPKLRLNTGEPEPAPQPLKFSPLPQDGARSEEMTQGVERAIEDAQRRLDDLRATAPVWIAGPPGAGKTALVSSYLEAARAGVLWYQVDPADSDPATFFYFLRELVLVNTPRRGRALPLFTPEYLPDLRGFARRFFREACLRMPAGTVLVLDNLQELAADSPVHSALVAFVEELPEHAGILAISRTDPPPAFAECILNSRLSILSWNELRLSAEEGEAVAVAAGLQNIALARRFHEQTDGWFAGFSLLLERARAGTPSRVAVRADAMETVFDYFSQVIFERVPATVQHVLLVAALLPVAEAALVSRLAETSEALNVLESLYRRHLFLERTSSDTPTRGSTARASW